MCLIVFAYKTVPEIPLVLAGNRDEFYKRPTKKAHIWETNPHIIAGKDKKAGGTWLGISAEGRIAAITNYRDMSSTKPNAPSRGDIVKSALTSHLSTQEYLRTLQSDAERFNGFNLITGNRDKLFYFSNQTMKMEELNPGIYVISNALLNTSWPKTVWAKERFKQILSSKKPKTNDYFSLLLNSSTFPSETLPETGLSQEMEQAVSAVFIQTEDYGTRSSTILQLFDDDAFYFEERTYKAGSKNINSQEVFTRF